MNILEDKFDSIEMKTIITDRKQIVVEKIIAGLINNEIDCNIKCNSPKS